MQQQHKSDNERRAALMCAIGTSVILLTGCKGIPVKGERQARENMQRVESLLQPEQSRTNLPSLSPPVTLETLLRYAMLNQPRVRAAYYDYAAAVERITLERSLPDPRLTLELDIQDVVMTVMPGVMADVPWVQKLRIRAEEATAESQGKYYQFETAVLRTAYEVKKPFFQIHFLEDRIRITEDTLRLLAEVEQNARSQAEVGAVTLQDALRAQIEQERLRTELENLRDSRGLLLAQLKAALGLSGNQPDPPVPSSFAPTPISVDSDDWLTRALRTNPTLKQMEAEVRQAQVGIRMARQSRLPDFSLGIEADVKASPWMWRPSAGVTLPIWRDKIAAELAAAQARKNAAQARLNGEQIQVAVEVADKTYMFREATRNLLLLTQSLLPKARQSLEIARAGYSSAKTDFINLLDAERALLEFQMAEVDARGRRELAWAELSLLTAGIQPQDAPVLGHADELPKPPRETRR